MRPATIRQFSPKGGQFEDVTERDDQKSEGIDQQKAEKTLGYATPIEVFWEGIWREFCFSRLNSPQINTIAVTWWFVGERRGNRWPILAIGLIIYKRSEQ